MPITVGRETYKYAVTDKASGESFEVTLETLNQRQYGECMQRFSRYLPGTGGVLDADTIMGDFARFIEDMTHVVALSLRAVRGLNDRGGNDLEVPKDFDQRVGFIEEYFTTDWTQELATEVFERNTVTEAEAGNSASPPNS